MKRSTTASLVNKLTGAHGWTWVIAEALLRSWSLTDVSASCSSAGDPLGLLQSRLPQVRQRIQHLHGSGDHAAGERLFEEYREWLCPNDPHSDLLLMRRLAEGP